MSLLLKIIFSTLIVSFSITNSFAGQELKASWYSVQSLKDEGTWKTSHGKMANGQMFSDTKLTCATRRWPLGSILLVRNLRTGKAVRVIVTDKCNRRFKETRVDLSSAAFSQIERLETGLLKVEVIRVK
jgi:rare lipoprotein A